jgi:hypothetical protein
MKEYNEFEKLLDECNSTYDTNKDKEKSKWIIRMAMNKTEMLDKNISMDDIHFGLMSSYNNVTCMYTDYNSDKLIFAEIQSEFLIHLNLYNKESLFQIKKGLCCLLFNLKSKF